MNEHEQSIQAIQDIKSIMERSSRFISLSGFSGISAGICALIGVWLVYPYIQGNKSVFINEELAATQYINQDFLFFLNMWPFWIMLATFICALISAFIFTYSRSKNQRVPIWGKASKRVMISLAVPIIAGGIFIYHLVLTLHGVGFIAPACLIFYGLALISAGKYTLGEVSYLGYLQLLLGILNLWFIGYGLYFWAMGFGILHIIYGMVMWNKYERKSPL